MHVLLSPISKMLCFSSKLLAVGLLVAGTAISMAREANAQTELTLPFAEQIELDLNDGQTYRLSYGLVRIDVRVIDPTADDYDEFIRVSVAEKGGKSFQRDFETSFAKYLTIGVLPLDRDGTPSIVMQNFTGGAHCCMEIYSLYLGQQEWREAEIALVDGGTVDPSDRDGDGLVEFVIPDGRFFYTFDSYADSRVPSQVVATFGGDYLDMTSEGGYLSLLLDEYDYLAGACIGSDANVGSNSACASLLAVSSRLGIFEGTLSFVQELYSDRQAQDYEWTDFTISDEMFGDVTFDNLPDAAAHAVVQWNIL